MSRQPKQRNFRSTSTFYRKVNNLLVPQSRPSNTSPALLPIFSYRRRVEPVALWTAPSSDPGAEYYEIQVQAEEFGDSSEERENASKQRCPICEVDVPKLYWDEHKSAAKHLTSAAVAATALDRTLKVMSAETAAVSLAPIAGNNSTYYCSSCSCAVSLSKRSAHENSKQHLDSVLYDKLIDSFLILYKDKDKLKAVCEDIVKIIGEKEVVKELQLKKKLGFDADGAISNEFKVNINNNQLHSKRDVIKPTDLYKESNKDSSKNNISKLDTKEESHDYYFEITDDLNKVVCVFCNLKLPNKTESINQHSSHVNHKNNRKRFLSENYLEDLDGTNVFCGICKKKVLIVNELDHNNSKKHKKHKDILLNKEAYEDTRKKFLEENYLEDIDGINVYCGVCRKTVLKINELEHINSKKHKKHKDILLNKDTRKKFLEENDLEDIDGINVSCGICRKTVLKINELDHINSKKHKKLTDSIFNKEMLIKQGKNNVESGKSETEGTNKLEDTNPAPVQNPKKLYYLFNQSKYANMLKCKICDINFPKDKAEEHKSDLNHNQIYIDLLESGLL